MAIMTGRYSNKELRNDGYYPVGISVGKPRFSTGYEIREQCYALAPRYDMLKLGYEEYKAEYFKKLDKIGVDKIIAIIDVSGLSRSKIASKQLAHNAISGFDDPSILREICKMLDDVDDMLESFIGKDIMEEPLEQYDKLLSPAVHFDFKNITFSFLPHQVKDMDALVKNLESSAPEIIGVAPYEQCKQFIEALARYQKFSDIRNVGAAIHSMIESVTEKMDEVGFKDDEEWTYLTKIFGSNAIPAEAAATITKAIKKAEKDGAITSKNRWQLIEMLATEYLAGK